MLYERTGEDVWQQTLVHGDAVCTAENLDWVALPVSFQPES